MAGPDDKSAFQVCLDRFTRLPQAQQLDFFRVIGDYLAHPAPPGDGDGEVLARTEALDAVRLVGVELGKNPGSVGVEEFDATAARLGITITARQVRQVWGGWRLMRDAIRGAHGRQSAYQRGLRRSHRLRQRTHDDVIEGIRLWLASGPIVFGKEQYDWWVKEYNANRPEAALPLVVSATIRQNLGLTWAEVLRVARGEIELADARRYNIRREERRGWLPHDLVCSGEVAALIGVHATQIQRLADQSDFPTPVLVIRRKRHWLRSDVCAYRDGLPVPPRKFNELSSLYVGSAEIATMIGRAEGSVWSAARRPECWLSPPGLVLSGVAIWQRSEVEKAMARRKPRAPRGRRS